MIAYIIISIIYWGTFAAFMQVNKEGTKYWDHYSWGESNWKMEMTVLCILGGFFWPIILPLIAVYKIAFKILNKNKNK